MKYPPNKVKSTLCELSHSVVSNSLVTSSTIARPAPPSMGFSRQDHWGGLLSFSKGPSWPRDWTCISYGSCIGRRILHQWATWETLNFTLCGILLEINRQRKRKRRQLKKQRKLRRRLKRISLKRKRRKSLKKNQSPKRRRNQSLSHSQVIY